MTMTITEQQTKAQIQHARLLKKFHTLCTKKGLTDEDKEALLEGFGKTSSKDMSSLELAAVIGALEGKRKQPTGDKMDTWRKRVIAAVFGYHKTVGKAMTMAAVKAVVTRQSGYATLNKIPEARLIALYNYWNHATQQAKAGEAMKGGSND